MSRLSRLRKKVNYDTDVPRCQTCIHFRKSRTFFRDSLPVKSHPLCHKHDFIVAPMSVCDNWQDRKGSTLESCDPKVTSKSS